MEIFVFVYYGDLPGVLSESLEIHGEDLEYDNIFAFVFVMYLYCDVFVMGMYFGQAKV